MSEIKLSAVIITFNEEKNIARCLESLVNVADEIIIVDSFSTDGTAAIAEKFPVKFIRHPWEGYSQTKNYANSLASGDFILSLDADEVLSDELREVIIRLKTNLNFTTAYQFNRLTNYCGKWIKHGGWYPEWKVRIFSRQDASWQGTIHEELKLTEGTTYKKLNGTLLHYSYPTVDSHLKKILQYAALIGQQDAAKGRSRNILYHGIIKPQIFFLKQYVLKLGFLDGYYGFVIAVLSAFERYMRYVNFKEFTKSVK